MDSELGKLKRMKQQYDEALLRKEEDRQSELDGYRKHIEGLNEEITELKGITDTLSGEISDLK